jgi:hypothetical protein
LFYSIFILGDFQNMPENNVLKASVPPIQVLTTTAPWKSVSSSSSSMSQQRILQSKSQGKNQGRSLQPVNTVAADKKQLISANNKKTTSMTTYLQNNQTTLIAENVTNTSPNKEILIEVTTKFIPPTTLEGRVNSSSAGNYSQSKDIATSSMQQSEKGI